MTVDEIVKEWCAELRSGRWEQRRGHLGRSNSNGRCCLGVLCELAVRHGAIAPPASRGGILIYDGIGTTLPWRVAEWARVPSSEGVYGSTSLMSLNDGGTSFREIADIIESRPDGLFEEGA